MNEKNKENDVYTAVSDPTRRQLLHDARIEITQVKRPVSIGSTQSGKMS